jgi:hypothetical protein
VSPPARPPLPSEPGRYGSRYGTEPAAPAGPGCPVCAAPLPSRRARYCSEACKQRAYRLRQPPRAGPELAHAARELRRQRAVGRHTVYECPLCGERSLGPQRCPECQRFGRAVGLGGLCPHCDEPVVCAELLGDAGAPGIPS